MTEKNEYPAGTEVPDEAEDDPATEVEADQPGLRDDPPASS